MPLYEYECQHHGRFEAFAPLDSSHEPSACPACATAARRVVSLPTLRGIDRTKMAALDRNEKSKHDPHVCHSGCHHNHAPSQKKKVEGQAPALQQYKGARPWVVEHA